MKPFSGGWNLTERKKLAVMFKGPSPPVLFLTARLCRESEGPPCRWQMEAPSWGAEVRFMPFQGIRWAAQDGKHRAVPPSRLLVLTWCFVPTSWLEISIYTGLHRQASVAQGQSLQHLLGCPGHQTPCSAKHSSFFIFIFSRDYFSYDLV